MIRLGGHVHLASSTAVVNAESALNDLRDPQDDLASYVRAFGQTLITHVDKAQDWALEALRQRVRELNPKAHMVEDEATAAENVLGQVDAARKAAAESP